MDRINVVDLHEYQNQEIDLFLLVTKKELREGKKDHFIRIEFVDKTGHISGNIWINALAVLDHFQENDVVKIRATITNYKEQIQLNVKKIRKANENEYDIDDFIQTSKKDINLLSDKLFEYIESLLDNHIKKLLLNIYEDKEIWNKFIKCPAAKSWHHNFVGGLLEHTINVTDICNFVGQMYTVNRDELIAGSLLHDFGKIFEYNLLPSIDFTDEGRLLGHIVMADQIITEKAKEINLFPHKTLMKIRHLILSHHGEMEKGAVKLPQTIEAVILHYADNMDAQTMGVSQLINASTDPNARWSEYDKLNNRYIFLG